MLAALDHNQLVLACHAQHNKSYYCPECHQKLILRHGQVKLAHFAHLQHSRCVMNDGETYEHLLGKQQLFEWALSQGWQPEMEKYNPLIRQRADVLIYRNQRPIALEFQCSPLSLQRHCQRNAGYQKVKWQYYWILGSSYNRKLSRVKQAQFIQYVNQQYCLLYWDVQQQKIIVHPYQVKHNAIVHWQQHLLRLTKLQDPMLLKLQQQLTQKGHLIKLCPTFCHQSSLTLPITKHDIAFWRICLAQRLASCALFQTYSMAEWWHFLAEVGQNEWTATPCLDHCLAQTEWQEVTADLINAGLIKKTRSGIMIMQHPHWFQSSYDKEQEMRRQCFTFNQQL